MVACRRERAVLRVPFCNADNAPVVFRLSRKITVELNESSLLSQFAHWQEYTAVDSSLRYYSYVNPHKDLFVECVFLRPRTASAQDL